MQVLVTLLNMRIIAILIIIEGLIEETGELDTSRPL
jgi:hypothetical protein